MTFTRNLTLAALFCSFVFVAACGKAALFCDEDTPCTDPNRPFCDLTGEFPDSDGIGKTCIANPIDAGVTPMCSANETVCESDVLVSCDADGNVAQQTDCLLGCHDTEVRCNKLDPSNGLAEHLDDAEANGPDIQLGDGATFDTTNGEVRTEGGALVSVPSVLLPAPTGGVERRVFKVKSIVMGDATVTGTAAMVLLSGDDVVIEGDLFVESGVGAGQDNDVEVCPLPSLDLVGGESPGGGGGGFGESGGAGGAGRGPLGTAGRSAVGSENISPFRGGCPGLRFCNGPFLCACIGGDTPSIRGVGGGAIHIAALTRIRVGIDGAAGSIQAHGAGARAGCGANAGLGGGSGGAILLEAGTVDLFGALAANGGGGSCLEQSGSDGDLAGSSNGASCLSPHGSGGRGGTVGRVAAAGDAALDGTGGGGGGAVGRIRINSQSGQLGGQSTVLSPNPSLGLSRTR